MSVATGLAVAPETGIKPPEEVVTASQMTVTSETLPMLVKFNGRRYVLLETKNGGLLLNGAVTIGGQRVKR
jgi:hemin uptake protein HemP